MSGALSKEQRRRLLCWAEMPNTKRPYHPLPDDYLALIAARDVLSLTIMGKDPYPTEPMGIPFCKPTWDTMCEDRASGLHVLLSLGVDIDTERERHQSPRELYCCLARDRGIAFTNLSYHYLGESARRDRHSQELRSAESINCEIVGKSRALILCGEASKRRWYSNTPPAGIQKSVVHPDNRCRISPYDAVRSGWLEWWQPRAIEKWLAEIGC